MQSLIEEKIDYLQDSCKIPYKILQETHYPCKRFAGNKSLLQESCRKQMQCVLQKCALQDTCKNIIIRATKKCSLQIFYESSKRRFNMWQPSFSVACVASGTQKRKFQSKFMFRLDKRLSQVS